MDIFKRLTAIGLIIVVFPITLHGANPDKPISLQIKDLTRWKNSREASAIQQALGAMLKPRPQYPRIAEPFEGAKQYAPLFKKPFLVLEAEPGDFGGFFALVVFKNHPKVFSLWIYEIDRNVFELREIEPLRVTLNKIIMDELADKRITPFWLQTTTNIKPKKQDK